MRSRESEIAAVTGQINDLLSDLAQTVAALNAILAPDPEKERRR